MKKIASFIFGAMLVACCACSQDEPEFTDIASADVTFAFEIPQELYRYYEITSVHNNAEITDVEVEYVYDRDTYSYTCHLNRVPEAVPLQLQFRRTNRPIPSDLGVIIKVKESVTFHRAIGDTTVESDDMYFSPKSGSVNSNTVQNFAVRVYGDGTALFVVKE